MAKVTHTFINAADMDKQISLFGNSVATVTKRAQVICCSIAKHLHDHGDYPSAVKWANDLVKALGKGMKGQQMLRWFEYNTPMVFNSETKELVRGFGPTSPVKEHGKIDVGACISALWFEAMPEQAYQPIGDLNSLLAGIIKKAEKDRKELGDKSKISVAQLEALKSLQKANPAPIVPEGQKA